MGLTVAGAFVFQGLTNPSAISSHLRQSLEVGAKPFVCGRTVLEAFEISFQIRRGLGRKAIDSPCSVASALDHSLLTEIGEMLGNFGLRKAKDFLEVTDTKRTVCQQMDDSQPGGIAETLVNRDQLHDAIICIYTYICRLKYFLSRYSGASRSICGCPAGAGLRAGKQAIGSACVPCQNGLRPGVDRADPGGRICKRSCERDRRIGERGGSCKPVRAGTPRAAKTNDPLGVYGLDLPYTRAVFADRAI